MSAVLPALSNIVSVIMAVLFIPLTMLTYGIDAVSASVRTESSRINIAGVSAYLYSQGITTDGEYFWFSSKNTLIKTQDDKKTIVAANYFAIPDELKEQYNSKHIGGISYYSGKIYAGIEDSKTFLNPVIGVYDADTLEMLEYYPIDEKDDEGNLLIQKGVPWVAVNPDTGYLYTTNHNKTPDKYYYYDVNDSMKRVGSIDVSQSLYGVQGAEFYNGTLYLATFDDTQAIYKADIETGEIVKIIDRNLTAGSEGEGMTVFVRDGKPVIVAMDLGPIFINAFVREYECDFN